MISHIWDRAFIFLSKWQI